MTDHKAVYGSQPAWDLQQKKQEEIARERDERMAAADEKARHRQAMNEDWGEDDE